tara:strand:+ start:1224 stop:1442 length:219 start_codon:yes stop_codon:yes gene_type:complete
MEEIFMHKKYYIKKFIILYKLRYKYFMNIFIIWLVLVIAWNFGYPQASPFEDVIVAVILSILNIGLKKYFKL